MVVMLVEDHELPLVEGLALIRTGSRLEPAAKTGLADLTGEVLRSGGSETMGGDDLDDYLEGKAASIETSISEDLGRASLSCLKADFPEVLKVFADLLRHPAFAADKLEVARTGAFASIARQNDNPQGILFRKLTELVLGADSPYARTPTYASVGAITRDDLVAWHRRYFHPERIELGLVGDFDSDRVLALVRAAFGDWPRGPAGKDPEAPFRKTPAAGRLLRREERHDPGQHRPGRPRHPQGRRRLLRRRGAQQRPLRLLHLAAGGRHPHRPRPRLRGQPATSAATSTTRA